MSTSAMVQRPATLAGMALAAPLRSLRGSRRALSARVAGPGIVQAPMSCRSLGSTVANIAVVATAAARCRYGSRTVPPSVAVTQRFATTANQSPPSSIFFHRANEPTIEISATAAIDWSGDSLVLFLRSAGNGTADVPKVDLGHIGDAVNHSLKGALSAFVIDDGFEAKAGDAKVLPIHGAKVKRVVLVGVGPADAQDNVDWRLAGAAAAKAVKGSKGGGSVGVVYADGLQVQPFVEGLFLGLHTDVRFRGAKTPEKEKLSQAPASLQLLGALPEDGMQAVGRAQAVASGVVFARELVNGPANVVTPPGLVLAAENLASQLGLDCKILTEEQCEAMGMGAFLSVGRCSNLPSQLIHLTYKPEGTVSRKVGIIGKGLTFDSGGYNLKAGPGSMIEMMKFDMGGAATTLGTAATIAQLRPAGVEVHFIIATCENMISGNVGSLRPGDIVTAMDGTTIEVNNTDAEGRLTLADAMLYCQQQGITEVVDVATLTGACMIALGQDIAGMWSNSDELAERLSAAARATGEKLWRMPLEDAYFEGMKSDFADMKNSGPRFGGAITAALFLSKFAEKGTQWAHLDIAGTVWAEKAKGVNIVGGTGTMVRTLTELVSKS